MAENASVQATIPVTDLSINFKDTTLVIEPTAAIDGFDKDSYDSVVLTTTLELNNPTERVVEIPLPFPAQSFSASIAVISKGTDEYSDRLTQITKVKGDVERFTPYLRRMQVSEETLSDKSALKKLLESFRVGLVNLPAGNLAVRIQITQVVKADPSDTSRKTFKFRSYAPLPSFLVGGGASMRLTAVFKQVDRYPRTIAQVSSNPFGDAVGLTEPLTQNWCGDAYYHWDWKNDPVIDWTYSYS